MFADFPARIRFLLDIRGSTSPRRRSSARDLNTSQRPRKVSIESPSPSKPIREAPGTRSGLIANLVAEFSIELSQVFSNSLFRFVLRPLHGRCKYLQTTKTEDKKSAGHPPRGLLRGGTLVWPHRAKSTTRMEGRRDRKAVGSLTSPYNHIC